MRGDFEMGGTPIADAVYDALRGRRWLAKAREEFFDESKFVADCGPAKLLPLSGPVTTKDGTVLVPRPKRGSVLQEAITTINGERQDVYGSPEDSFQLIANYWNIYLNSVGDFERIPETEDDTVNLKASDVAMMMTLFKIAREANQHKRDNIVDAGGYLGIYADMQGEG